MRRQGVVGPTARVSNREPISTGCSVPPTNSVARACGDLRSLLEWLRARPDDLSISEPSIAPEIVAQVVRTSVEPRPIPASP